MASFSTKIKKFFATLMPGIITGASDDDPSGIAAYSQQVQGFDLDNNLSIDGRLFGTIVRTSSKWRLTVF